MNVQNGTARAIALDPKSNTIYMAGGSIVSVSVDNSPFSQISARKSRGLDDILTRVKKKNQLQPFFHTLIITPCPILG